MRHKYFEATNFKGINYISFNFEAKPQSGIYTLVGLNESGKTTVLEALDYLGANYLDSQPDSIRALDPSYSSQADPHDLIPMGKRSNFNGMISVKAAYALEHEDKLALRSFLENELDFILTEDIEEFTLERKHDFVDSKVKNDVASKLWSINFKGHYKVTGRRKPKALTITAKEPTREHWIKTVNFLKSLLPGTMYFPNFLFEFPNKIYLEDRSEANSDEAQRDRTYRTVLQDVLDADGEGMDLTRHVLERAKSDARHDKQALESALLKLDSHITRTVFGNWNRIFSRAPGNRQIVTNCDCDENGRWFLRLRLKDNNQYYEISERSLGFRWFFSFLLLTQYRGFRKGVPKNVLFLLDEPASNLHPSAQQQLLGSFGNMGACSIIYTTHSHHMINPAWLESTYVVKNAGLDYDAEDAYSASETDVILKKYRVFADEHPNQTTYFQPILDVLDYRVGALENVPKVVMMEGKNDFYTLMYFKEKVLSKAPSINLMPGNGSGSLDAVIRLYMGWGRDFVVILDSDKSGKNQKKRYEEVFGPLVEGRIFCLDDIDPAWSKGAMEALVAESDRMGLQLLAYPESKKFHKDHFNRAVQQAYLTDARVAMTAETTGNMTKILEFCAEKFEAH